MGSKAKIRKNDQVLVIAGKDRGKRGKILEVNASKGKVLVEGLNEVKRHTKPNNKNRQGGIVTKSLPLSISNVMLIDPESTNPTRVGRRIEKDKNGREKLVRYAKKSGATIPA